MSAHGKARYLLLLLAAIVVSGFADARNNIPSDQLLIKHIELNLTAGVEIFSSENKGEVIGQAGMAFQFAGKKPVRVVPGSKLQCLLNDLGYSSRERKGTGSIFSPHGPPFFCLLP